MVEFRSPGGGEIEAFKVGGAGRQFPGGGRSPQEVHSKKEKDLLSAYGGKKD